MMNIGEFVLKVISKVGGLIKDDTIAAIIIGLISAFIGGIITYLAQWGLQSRIEAIRLSGKMVERKFEAYEKIIELLNAWGSVIIVPTKTIFQQFKIKIRTPLPYLNRSIVFESYEIFLDFMRKWHRMTQTTHMWVDSKVMGACRLVSWYLSAYVALADISNVKHSKSQEELNIIMEKFFKTIGTITFDDYHRFADPIYILIAKKTESPKLKTRKSSLREIHNNDRKKFEAVFKNTMLYNGWSDFRVLLLGELGINKDDAKNDTNYICPVIIKTDNKKSVKTKPHIHKIYVTIINKTLEIVNTIKLEINRLYKTIRRK